MMTGEELKHFIFNPPTMPSNEKKEHCCCVCRSYLSFNNTDRIATCYLCGGVVKDWYPIQVSVGDLSEKGRSSPPQGVR